MKTVFSISVSVFLFLNPLIAISQEVLSTAEDQLELRVSVYNSDLALVWDKRELDIEKGVSSLAFKEVSGKIKPETASLKVEGLTVLEQNFEYDLLSPQSLLLKYVGREVVLGTINPVTGEESEERAKVLSSGNGVVLQTDQHIITDIRGQIRFPDVPANLRDSPTLSMLTHADMGGQRKAELTYLSKGLSWKADYIAELNEQEDALELSGWVTLSNNSGATYRNAELQLIAGDVNIVEEHLRPQHTGKFRMMADAASLEDSMREEAVFEYHMYSLGRKTTIADNQQKQLALIGVTEVACAKEFFLKGEPYYYRGGYGDLGRKLKIGVFVGLKNEKKAGLGRPLPAGIIRVYKKDDSGFLQFIGEDRIEHTPEGENVRLKLGEAFDITADKRQTEFRKISGGDQEVIESEYELTLRNAKKMAVTVRVEEPVPGDWEVLSESLPHRKEASNILSWDIEVPAEGEQKLVYRVRVRY